MNTRSGPLTALIAVMAFVALLLASLAYVRNDDAGVVSAGTGGDGAAGAAGDEVAAGSPAVDVALTEFAIGDGTVDAGPGATLAVSNEGQAEHNLTLRGMEDEYATANLAAGDAEELSLAGLAPGDYEMYCTIAGHEAAGMVGTLVIAEDAAVAEGGVADDAEGVGADDGSDLTGMERADWLRANYEASVSQFPAETEVMGNQRMEPEILPDGTKLFELELSHTEWEVAPGEFVDAVAYNGQVPGPWIDVEVGDDVLIRVINGLEDEYTTLHPHGIFMHAFEVDGVGMISMDPIAPGDSYDMEFTPQETSVGMYHGHDNGVYQVINGAFGAFTVGEIPLPEQADNVVAEEVMVLNDAGEIGLTLNAKSFPATQPYVLTQGEQMILHFYNEGLTAHPMHLHNNAMMVVAKDGYPLAVPIVMDTVNVAPGERYSVVVFAEGPGTWVFHCHILSHVERSDGSVFGMFTALIVEPSDDPAINEDLSRELGRDQIPMFPGQTALPAGEDGGDDAAEVDGA